MLRTGVEANTLTDGELLPERESKQRSELVPKIKFTECDVSATIAESREACKRLRKLGTLRKTAAAHVVVTLIDTAQPCNPRLHSLEISFDVRAYMERNDEGKMDPERGQLEPPSAGTC